MTTSRSAEGALRHSAGVIDQAGQYAPELLGETDTDLSPRVVRDLTDTRLAEHLDAADQAQTPDTIWGNTSVGTFSSRSKTVLRDLPDHPHPVALTETQVLRVVRSLTEAETAIQVVPEVSRERWEQARKSALEQLTSWEAAHSSAARADP